MRQIPEDFNQRLIEAVKGWAARHPNPDAPLISGGGRVLSARQLAEELEQGTEIGRKHLEVFRHFVEVNPNIDADGYIKLFEKAGTLRE